MPSGITVLFLDIDGVCNTFDTPERHPQEPDRRGINPGLAALVQRIVAETKCDVVLTSVWRRMSTDRRLVRRQVVPFVDVTGVGKGRGQLIQDWLDEHPECVRYAILDDTVSDMLPNQRPNLFQTYEDTGLTEEIAQAVIAHLKRR